MIDEWGEEDKNTFHVQLLPLCKESLGIPCVGLAGILSCWRPVLPVYQSSFICLPHILCTVSATSSVSQQFNHISGKVTIEK